MPNLVDALKTEIVQVAQRALRSEAQQFKKATATQEREIAALQRRIDSLERLVVALRGKRAEGPAGHRVQGAKRLRRPSRAAHRPIPDGPQDEGPALRFSAKGFTKLRQRLGLSAAAMGALLGVTAQSVYKWEDGKARPRATQLQAIAAIRKLGKREAAQRLADLEGSQPAERVTH
jgi:DNA-binding XRE family transcriptional regulator